MMNTRPTTVQVEFEQPAAEVRSFEVKPLTDEEIQFVGGGEAVVNRI